MSSGRKILLLSSSKVFGYEYLEYAKDDINKLFEGKSTILFIPYALKNHDAYLNDVEKILNKWGYKVTGIHKHQDPVEAVNKAEAIFIGGGNTFQLLKMIYEKGILDPIRKRVLTDNLPYLGSSAGTNVATKSIHTTNDMPIVYPPSFEALNLVPFNINPHYLDIDPSSKHQGETREERILQYLDVNGGAPVLGLREGASLFINGNKATLHGIKGARLFIPGEKPKEFEVGADLSFLLN